MGVDVEMFFDVPDRLSEEQFKLLNFDLASTFPDFFHRGDNADPLAFTAMDQHEIGQLVRSDDWPAYRVLTYVRYYGPGYERGPFLDIKGVADWIEHNIPNARVYYGGDCDGEFERWDKETRENFYKHFLEHNTTPYRSSFSSIFSAGPVTGCGRCARPLLGCGGGQGKAFYQCSACSKRFIKDTDGLRQTEKFF